MHPFTIESHELDSLPTQLSERVEHYFNSTSLHRRPDRLAFLIRPDCGMIFVNLIGAKISREVGSISLPFLESRYFSIASPNAPASFEEEHDKILQSMRELVRSKLIEGSARRTMLELSDRHSLRITTIEYEDMETEQLVDLQTV